MTNNPTIDGVSRRVCHACVLYPRDSYCPVCDPDPVVERQPFAYYFKFAGYTTSEGPQGWRTEIELEKPADFLFSDGRVKDFTPLYDAPPEVAALQSTIAQLEDKLKKAIDLDFQRRETIEQLQARIQELESGRGEPVMKLEAERLWEGAGEYFVSFVKAGWLAECRKTGGEFLLYTAPPAPVAVVLPERKPDEWRGTSALFARGWNACLDATAALNGPAK